MLVDSPQLGFATSLSQLRYRAVIRTLSGSVNPVKWIFIDILTRSILDCFLMHISAATFGSIMPAQKGTRGEDASF